MNKLVKGSIAGGLGVVLLLGGAGTLALWNQTAVVAGGNVTAGLLTIDATGGAQSWRDISAEVVNPTTAPDGVAIADIANYKIVPGDKIKFTKVVTVKATGDHLKGKLSYDDATIVAPVVAGATAQNTANADLKAKLLPTFTATGTGVTSTTTGGVTEYFVTPGTTAINTTVTLTLTLELPAAVGNTTGEGVIAQNGTVNLTGVAFKLNQIRP